MTTTHRRWGIREVEDRRRPFMFASLAMTDDDSVAAESETQADVGTVKVKLVYVVEEGQRRFTSKADRIVPGMVHERSKNLGVQCVSCVLAQP
ncbi:hypothetical protein DAEQUDRAFT_78211 [Daedalea quercina L-15889]|uniref:Uncharacterized protein n=1 Tax=Daedalea quercina L-15889 TaxID=1314783 RepID=A0A165SFX3_9APHY|nr:hypothetical protein DAEQUDRAFT_78211 [Daedalea quercina L-15889]